MRLSVFSLYAIVSSVSISASPINYGFDRAACQQPNADVKTACPRNTLVVGPSGQYTTVQGAVTAIPHQSNETYYVLIQAGNYTEQVNVTQFGPVYFLGQTQSPNDRTQNRVNIIWHQATGTNTTGTLDNEFTSTLTIAPTLNSSLTGSGPTGNTVPPGTPFGTKDFRAYNIDFINDYLPYSAGPSLALSMSYANAGFYYCGWYSYQDTIYVGKLGNAYFYENEVAGQTDFFYGFGTAWIQSSKVSLRGCGGGITAWKGTNTTFVNKYGVYIHDSHVVKANSTLNITGECALGRPWNAQHRSIFANCYLDDSIRPSGYIEWSATDPRVNYNTTMAEYHDYGPGFNITGRLEASNVTKELTTAQYEPYSTLERVFQYPFSGKFGNTAWIDRSPAA